MSAARPERIKLTAAFLNTIGAAFIVAGFVGPVASLTYGFGTTALALRTVVGLGVVWILSGVAIHSLGLLMLGRLDR